MARCKNNVLFTVVAVEPIGTQNVIQLTLTVCTGVSRYVARRVDTSHISRIKALRRRIPMCNARGKTDTRRLIRGGLC